MLRMEEQSGLTEGPRSPDNSRTASLLQNGVCFLFSGYIVLILFFQDAPPLQSELTTYFRQSLTLFGRNLWRRDFRQQKHFNRQLYPTATKIDFVATCQASLPWRDPTWRTINFVALYPPYSIPRQTFDKPLGDRKSVLLVEQKCTNSKKRPLE